MLDATFSNIPTVGNFLQHFVLQKKNVTANIFSLENNRLAIMFSGKNIFFVTLIFFLENKC